MRLLVAIACLSAGCFAHREVAPLEETALEVASSDPRDEPPCGEGERIERERERRRTAVPLLRCDEAPEVPKNEADPDNEAPRIHCPTVARDGERFVLHFEIVDAHPVVMPEVHWVRAGRGAFAIEPKLEGGLYVVGLPLDPDDGPTEFWIEAYDELGNGPGRLGGPEHPLRIELQPSP